MAEAFTSGGDDLYAGDQPNMAGGSEVFGSSPFTSVSGGGAWAAASAVNWSDPLSDPAALVRAANEALMVVGLIMLFFIAFYQGDAAQDATQFAAGILIGSSVSNALLDNSVGGWVVPAATTVAGLASGTLWAALSVGVSSSA